MEKNLEFSNGELDHNDTQNVEFQEENQGSSEEQIMEPDVEREPVDDFEHIYAQPEPQPYSQHEPQFESQPQPEFEHQPETQFEPQPQPEPQFEHELATQPEAQLEPVVNEPIETPLPTPTKPKKQKVSSQLEQRLLSTKKYRQS